MTITNQASQVTVTGTGAQTTFNYSFRIPNKGVANLYLEDTTTGVVTLLDPALWSITGLNEDAGGTFTYPLMGSPITTDETLRLVRDVPATQPTNLNNQGRYYPQSVEGALDWIVMQIQQFVSGSSRALRVPEESVDEVPSVAVRANRFLAFNASGQPIASAGTPGNVPVSIWAEAWLGLTTNAAALASLGFSAFGVAWGGLASAFTGRQTLNVPEMVTAENYGAVGDGVANDGAALAAALAASPVVVLRPGGRYLISSRILVPSGGGFVCPNGRATIVAKTGAGAYNSTDLAVSKTALGANMLLWNVAQGGVLRNIDFEPDGLNQRVIYPVRVNDGMDTAQFIAENVRFRNFAILRGAMLSINSVGEAAYDLRNIEARDCGTSLNTWTSGSPQITAVEVDNDMVGGVASFPGYMQNIRGINLALTGAALAAYGQQTDVLNIAGIGSNRKGPVVFGVYGDNVGEILDIFCRGAIIKGIRGRNVQVFGVKLIHGANENHIEVEDIESVSLAAVCISGSASTAIDCEFNVVKLGIVREIGVIGAPSDYAAVFILEPGGATSFPQNNLVIIENCPQPGQYFVRDNSVVATSNSNRVIVHKGGVPSIAHTIGLPGNLKASFNDDSRVRMIMAGIQNLTAATPTIADFNTVVFDALGEAMPGSKKIRCKTPGNKQVYVSARLSNGYNAGADFTVTIRKGGATIASNVMPATVLAAGYTITAAATVYIAENECGTAAADIDVFYTVSTGGGPNINNSSAITYLEVSGIQA